tara:strand:- start:1879 stop:2262 length:384 start_codon:yes stop_codon:yes gene_type:complete
MQLTNQEKIKLQKKKRGEIALKLCVVMMVSDRKIHDDELSEIYGFLNEDEFFSEYIIDEDDLIDLIVKIQEERVKLGLYEIVKKYSTIADKKTRIYIKQFMTKVMFADGHEHEKEQEAIKILEDIWN